MLKFILILPVALFCIAAFAIFSDWCRNKARASARRAAVRADNLAAAEDIRRRSQIEQCDDECRECDGAGYRRCYGAKE